MSGSEFERILAAVGEVLQLVPTSETSEQKARLETLSKDLASRLRAFEAELEQLPGARRDSHAQSEELQQILQETRRVNLVLASVASLDSV